MPQPLGEDEIRHQLRDVEGWAGDATGLRRTVQAADFPTAIRIVDAVAAIAEEMSHHPDIDIRWRTLHFSLTTHSAGGVTAYDFALARRIDDTVRAYTH